MDGVRSGDALQIAIVLTIQPGYHINAHVPSLDYLIPTRLAFDTSDAVRMAEPQYPQPIRRTFEFAPGQPLDVYEGRGSSLPPREKLPKSITPPRFRCAAR